MSNDQMDMDISADDADIINMQSENPLNNIASLIPEEEIENMKKEFQQFIEHTEGGLITRKELETILTSLEQPFDEQDIQNMIPTVNEEGYGQITFEAFFTFITTRKTPFVNNREEMLSAMKIFDKRDDGLIEIEEFKEYMLTRGNRFRPEEFEKLEPFMLAAVDPEVKNHFNYTKYVDLIIAEMEANE